VPQPCKHYRRRDKDAMKAPRIVAATFLAIEHVPSSRRLCHDALRGTMRD
jgi:hypothetical protein